MTNTITAPALVSVVFTPLATGFHADVQIHAHNETSVILTVIHETRFGVRTFDLVGQESLAAVLHMQDGEGLILLARLQGSIVASGVFELRTELAEAIDAVLAPHAMSNLIVDQCEGKLIDRALTEALSRTGMLTLEGVAR